MTDLTHHRISALALWLDIISALQKPDVISLIGAGNGSGELAQWVSAQSIDHLQLVEADKSAFEQLYRSMPDREGWQIHHRLITPRGERTARWHQYDLASENSLLDPESLKAIWPGIQETQSEMTDGISLAELLNDSQASSRWLLLDCMPAADLLADVDLGSVSLILARTINAKDRTQVQILDRTAELERLKDQLIAHGFEPIAIFEERNTAIVKALFARSNQYQQQVLKDAHDAKQAAEQEAQEQMAEATQNAERLKSRLSRLEEENEGFKVRQRLLDEELNKAEAQIQLISELFQVGDDAFRSDSDQKQKKRQTKAPKKRNCGDTKNRKTKDA